MLYTIYEYTLCMHNYTKVGGCGDMLLQEVLDTQRLLLRHIGSNKGGYRLLVKEEETYKSWEKLVHLQHI